MSHVTPKQTALLGVETLEQYRKEQRSEPRWQFVNKNLGISNEDLNNNFEFLNGAVLNRDVKGEVLLTTTNLFGPIRTGTLVHLNPECANQVVQSEYAPMNPEADLVTELNKLHDDRTGLPPSQKHALEVDGYWTSAVDGAGIPDLDGAANVFGSTGQLICNTDELNFPLLTYGPTDALKKEFEDTLAYFGGKLLKPKEEFALGFTQDLWGIQYDQKLPQYITEYQFGAHKGGGLFVEHHPFPHIWLPAQGTDPAFGRKTVSRILLGRRMNTLHEDGYYRSVETQTYHFSMFEIPLDGSALAIRPQCIHNDSFTSGAQTVFLANTPANTVALRHSAPIKNMYVEGVPASDLPEQPNPFVE